MRRIPKLRRVGLGVGLVLAALPWLAACGNEEEAALERQAEQTRAIMHEIFEALQVALPVSADLDRFRAAESRAEIAAALDSLAANTGVLESHTGHRDPRMRQLARSVARDARATQRAFREGQYDRSAFLLREITENCVVCHSRLPSPGDSPLAEQFLDTGALAELPLEPRATLQIATRRFDAALETLEELLRSQEHPAVLLGPLTDYLVINVRVKDDFERPAETLRGFARRSDLWEGLRLDVEAWIAALDVLQARTRGEPDLETARSLLEEGKRMVDFPEDRDSLVHFVTASAILERIVAAGGEPTPELAEAYYLLGIIQARIGRNYWVTEAPFLLETAIRMAPGEPFASEAYSLLEMEIMMEYEGSDQEEVPPDVAARLAALRQLLSRS